MADNSKFYSDLDQFSVEMNIELQKVIRKVVFDIFANILSLSPVDYGTYRASHQIAIGKISDEIYEISRKGSKLNNEQADTIARQQLNKLSDIGPFDIVYISNNVPYAEVIEYGNESRESKGVYRLSLQKVEQELATFLRSL